MSVLPTREQIARTIIRATTAEELEEARTLRAVYLQSHPDDEDIQAMGNLLDALAKNLKSEKNHDGVTDGKK